MEPYANQPQNLNTPELPSPHKRHLPKFAMLLILLVLLGGTAAGSVWWWNQIQVADQEVPEFTPRATHGNSLDVSNWRTYTNTQYGFSIQLPTTFQWDVKEEDPNYYKGQSISFSVRLPNNSSFTYFYINIYSKTWWNANAVVDTQDLGTGFHEAYFKTPDKEQDLGTALGGYLNSNSKYAFTFASGFNDLPADWIPPNSEKIISTFKFTDQQSGTSALKSYINTKYGLSFKYPADLIISENPYGDRSSAGVPLELAFFTQASQIAKYSFILTNTSMDQLIQSRQKYSPTDTQLGSLPAKKDILPAVKNGDFAESEVFVNLGSYRFLAVSYIGVDSVFDQILSTLKFTN